MKVTLTSYGLPRRDGAESEDSFAVKAWDETVIAVLADGAGAARDAREASTRIVQSLMGNYAVRPPGWSPQKALSEFTRIINHTLHHESIAKPCISASRTSRRVHPSETVAGSHTFVSKKTLITECKLNDLLLGHVFSEMLGSIHERAKFIECGNTALPKHRLDIFIARAKKNLPHHCESILARQALDFVNDVGGTHVAKLTGRMKISSLHSR